MLKKFSLFSNRYIRFCLGAVLSCTLAISINLATVKPSYGISWLELMIRSIQIVQLSNMSDKQEIALGKEINQELLDSAQAKLYRHRSLQNYINEIGQRLAKTSDRPNIPYTFQVIDDDSINAFATMGGYVYINKGLIETADNEAELASVIGHEIGHIAGRHALKQMKERAISQGILSAAGLDRSSAVQIGVELALSRPNSRQDELEADNFGLENIKRANYAPAGMISFMNKLLKKGGGSLPSFLSTHPATAARIKALQGKIDPAQAKVGEGLSQAAYKKRISSH